MVETMVAQLLMGITHWEHIAPRLLNLTWMLLGKVLVYTFKALRVWDIVSLLCAPPMLCFIWGPASNAQFVRSSVGIYEKPFSVGTNPQNDLPLDSDRYRLCMPTNIFGADSSSVAFALLYCLSCCWWGWIVLMILLLMRIHYCFLIFIVKCLGLYRRKAVYEHLKRKKQINRKGAERERFCLKCVWQVHMLQTAFVWTKMVFMGLKKKYKKRSKHKKNLSVQKIKLHFHWC